MFVLFYRVCTDVRLGISGKDPFLFIYLLLYRVCTHVRIIILLMSLRVYVFVGVYGMYACKTGNFGNAYFYLCLCCCRGYLDI